MINLHHSFDDTGESADSSKAHICCISVSKRESNIPFSSHLLLHHVIDIEKHKN